MEAAPNKEHSKYHLVKLINCLSQLLRKPIALAVLALALCSTAADAAQWLLWVNVQGKDVRLIPGSGTGGRVVWSSSLGCWITDRAARGEWVDGYAIAETSREIASPLITHAEIVCAAGGARSISFNASYMPNYTWIGFNVPTNPAWNNNVVKVGNPLWTAQFNLPVGTR